MENIWTQEEFLMGNLDFAQEILAKGKIIEINDFVEENITAAGSKLRLTLIGHTKDADSQPPVF